MPKRIVFLLALLLVPLSVLPQKAEVDARLRDYFRNYEPETCRTARSKLDKTELNTKGKTLNIYTNDAFGEQPFRNETVEKIYNDIRTMMPSPVNRYRITVYAGKTAINDLVPNAYRTHRKADRQWARADEPDGNAWVVNASRPYSVSEGLEGRHLAINASHGAYYANADNKWIWQRPALFCTREDLLTQSIVFPYLIPMLRNAGAVVWTTRETDSQTEELIVDNDEHAREQGMYMEERTKKVSWVQSSAGFSTPDEALGWHDNPFEKGTSRMAVTASAKRGGQSLSAALWRPHIPSAGSYAVYVSYQTNETSVPDAHYIVVHKGEVTRFTVNQQMGGGTWVYLGTFDFGEGLSDDNMVVLTNESEHEGTVSADAVRLGGGEGNIMRGPDNIISGLPRYLEGARYWVQYAGFPPEDYENKGGENDYAEDINVRSHAANRLLGSSSYVPDSAGMGVPLELAFALHTDAGIDTKGIIGTLGICTTAFNDGLLGNGRLSRYASRDMVDMVQSSFVDDMRHIYPEWNRRGIWDRNYSESRICEVPSMILELLSHQNFNDMRFAHDPSFKFFAARAIYKGLLRYVRVMHGDKKYTVQPLPPVELSFGAPSVNGEEGTARLSWKEQKDTLEPSATPTAYVVYTRVDDGSFDNGRLVHGTHYDVSFPVGHVVSCKVTAVNKGGESFPSETLACGVAPSPKGMLLVVNGFTRLSGPAMVNKGDSVGFLLSKDPGVPYISTTAFCGEQKTFNPSGSPLNPDLSELGASGNELVGKPLMGNTFDFAAVHGAAALAAGYSFFSSSCAAFEKSAEMASEADVLDVFAGLQSSAGSSYFLGKKEKALSSSMQQRLSHWCLKGGRLLLSGSYLGADSSRDKSLSVFLHDVLHCQYAGSLQGEEDVSVRVGDGLTLALSKPWAGDETYPVAHPEVLKPVGRHSSGLSPFSYSAGNPASVAWKGEGRVITLGFPFEAAGNAESRAKAMEMMLDWLTE
ncbi:MAG: xanthan lyase [Bacteroidaceae bacterium]|nr:xanthan lyase [Bacteroidaceae bacterium]